MVVSSLIRINYVFCFTIGLVLTSPSFSCCSVYGSFWVLLNVGGDRWAKEGSSFPMTRKDLENQVNRKIAPRVCQILVGVTLGVQVLEKKKGDSQFFFTNYICCASIFNTRDCEFGIWAMNINSPSSSCDGVRSRHTSKMHLVESPPICFGASFGLHIN